MGDPPSIDVVEAGNGEVLGVVGGVVDAKLEDDKPLAPATRVRKKKEDEGGDDNRFKLRNGREVGRTPFCFLLFCFEIVFVSREEDRNFDLGRVTLWRN